MIKISSFYLFSNFLRITQEFYDDKITVNQKSLTAERDYEVQYKDISKIKFRKYSKGDQMNFGLSLFGLTSLIFLFFLPAVNSNTIVQRVGQVTFTTGVILFITGFAKYTHCALFDKNSNFLEIIKVKPGNQENAKSAIELIKQKSKIVVETNPENPFPEVNPIFEFVDYDIPDSISKSTTRFYKTELIESEKSLTDELVTLVKYNELSPKTVRVKHGNSDWTSLGCNLMYFSIAMISFPEIFNLPTTKLNFILFVTIAAISGIAFLLRFIKEEVVYFENLEGRTVYSMKITRKNKGDVEQILQFLEQKTAKKKSASNRSSKRPERKTK